MITDIDAKLLEKIADLTGKPVGAFNIRKLHFLRKSKQGKENGRAAKKNDKRKTG